MKKRNIILTSLLLIIWSSTFNTSAQSKDKSVKVMNIQEIKNKLTGEWISMAPEVRPSSLKNADGSIKPFYLTRTFNYLAEDKFELIIISYADAYRKPGIYRI